MDTARKPEPGELVAYAANGLTCVETFAEKYGRLRLVKPRELQPFLLGMTSSAWLQRP